MEWFLFLFLGGLLIAGTLARISILYVLLFWFLLLLIYGKRKGFSFRGQLYSAGRKIRIVSRVLLNLLLIGVFSSVLRMNGAISTVLSLCERISFGGFFLPAVFLFCVLVSLSTGSAYATSASAGVIFAAMGKAVGVPEPLLCGAVFSGIYVGDRISPVSSGQALIVRLTGVNFYDNLKELLKRFSVPFFLTLLLYVLLGYTAGIPKTSVPETGMEKGSLISLLPVVLVFLLSIFRVEGKLVLGIASLAGFLTTLCLKLESFSGGLRIMIFGYYPPEGSPVPAGGGMISMVLPSLIVAAATAILGAFDVNGFLDPIKRSLEGGKRSRSCRNVLTALLAGALGGSQAVSVVLASSLLYRGDRPKMKAESLEDFPVLIAPMIPWNTAYTVPATAIGAPLSCLLFSFYLYLVPLWAVLRTKLRRRLL